MREQIEESNQFVMQYIALFEIEPRLSNITHQSLY